MLSLVLFRVLGLSRSIEIDQRPDRKCRQSFIGILVGCRGVRTNKNFSCLFPKDQVSWFLLWGEGRAGLGVGLELLRWFAHPLVVLCARGVSSTLFLLLAFCKWQLGFWSFCFLFIICPNCACMKLFFSPL